MQEKYLLQGFDSSGAPEGFRDIYVSNYNLDKVGKVSDLRWVYLVDGHLAPGSGSGTFIIGESEFKVTYAWGGRNAPNGGYNERTSYTVRIKTNSEGNEILKKVADGIITDENGSLTYTKPFRECRHSFRGVLLGAEDYENHLKELQKLINESNDREIRYGDPMKISLFSDQNIAKLVASFKDQWEKNEPVNMEHRMKKIETDML